MSMLVSCVRSKKFHKDLYILCVQLYEINLKLRVSGMVGS